MIASFHLPGLQSRRAVPVKSFGRRTRTKVFNEGSPDSRTPPRPAGRRPPFCFEEEAIISYTLYLQELDDGRSPNVAASDIAIKYWKLQADAKLRDVILVVRADETHHNDVNHMFSDDLAGHRKGGVIAIYPEYAVDIIDLSKAFQLFEVLIRVFIIAKGLLTKYAGLRVGSNKRLDLGVAGQKRHDIKQRTFVRSHSDRVAILSEAWLVQQLAVIIGEINESVGL